MQDRVALGVDIGGTKVAAGLVEATGNILFKTRELMDTTGSDMLAMTAVHSVIRQCIEASRGRPVATIGVASPGPLALPSGIVLNAPNLPCWNNFPLGEHVRKEYHLPTYVDNDANAAGLAEAVWGAGAGFSSVFYATVGTGLGTAIVFDRKLYYGRTGAAGEGGHMTIDFRGEVTCGCGKPGCLEGLVAGPGIARRAQKLAAPDSKLLELANHNRESITARTVEEAWRAGDATAKRVLAESMDAIAVWLGNVIDLLEPDVIVIGGGLGSLVSEWFDYIRERIPSWSINSRSGEIPLVKAKFGVDAGIVGAAALGLVNALPGGLGDSTNVTADAIIPSRRSKTPTSTPGE